MYKFLVAEDSKVILRDIVHLIKESGYHSDIRTAYDGETALEILKDFAPDIIVTDIKMPVINGLTLIQKAKRLHPKVKCVIVSGYADFTFTHEALMLQVDDYVMKPIDPEEFGEILEKLTKEADDNRIRAEEAVLQQMIQDGGMANSKIRLDSYRLMLVRVGLFYQYAAPLARETVNGILECNRSEPDFWTVATRWSSEKVLVFDMRRNSREKILQQSHILLSELTKKYTRVNIICSEELKDMSRLNAQYRYLSGSLERKVMLDDSRVYEDEGQQDERQQYVMQKEEIEIFRKKMEKILKSSAVGDYYKEIHKNIQHWGKMQYSVSVIRKFLLVLLDEMFMVAGIGEGWIEEPGFMADKILNECRRLEELEKCLLAYGEFLTAEKEEKGGVSIKVAQKLTEYMQINLYKNLSLQEIADDFKISPSYICRIFKVYYSDTPISYYNRIKIEEARKLLDEYRNMRVKDIAELLGFNDQYYFSKVFKQQYGVSPLVYRTQMQEEKEQV